MLQHYAIVIIFLGFTTCQFNKKNIDLLASSEEANKVQHNLVMRFPNMSSGNYTMRKEVYYVCDEGNYSR